jgi:hypothetical protein
VRVIASIECPAVLDRILVHRDRCEMSGAYCEVPLARLVGESP